MSRLQAVPHNGAPSYMGHAPTNHDCHSGAVRQCTGNLSINHKQLINISFLDEGIKVVNEPMELCRKQNKCEMTRIFLYLRFLK